MIESDLGSGFSGGSNPRWNEPHGGELVPEANRNEIVDRLFDFLTRVKRFPRVEMDRD
jgi:hypothetical protein